MSSVDVQILKTIDNIKTAIELGQSQNLAADVAKLTAMLAAGVAAESTFRTYWALNGLAKALSDWRLGKAVSGREADIARAQALAGLVAAELVGRGIDYINDWNLGSKLYDLFHPDELSRSDFNRAKPWRWPRDPFILDLDSDGWEAVGYPAHIDFDFDGDGILTKTGWVGRELCIFLSANSAPHYRRAGEVCGGRGSLASPWE